MTDRQIEAARVAMTRFIKRGGKIWVRVFPDKPVTKKPQETRMGKGKGAPEGWVAVVQPGKILFEMEGVSEAEARRAMELAAAKLPIKTKFADAVRRGEAVMKATDLRELDVEGLQRQGAGARGRGVPHAHPEVDGAAREAGKHPRRAPRPGAREDDSQGEGEVAMAVEDRSAGRGRQRPRCRRASSWPSSAACSTASTARSRSARRRFLAHNENDDAKMGDTVAIAEIAADEPAQALGGHARHRTRAAGLGEPP